MCSAALILVLIFISTVDGIAGLQAKLDMFYIIIFVQQNNVDLKPSKAANMWSFVMGKINYTYGKFTVCKPVMTTFVIQGTVLYIMGPSGHWNSYRYLNRLYFELYSAQSCRVLNSRRRNMIEKNNFLDVYAWSNCTKIVTLLFEVYCTV